MNNEHRIMNDEDLKTGFKGSSRLNTYILQDSIFEIRRSSFLSSFFFLLFSFTAHSIFSQDAIRPNIILYFVDDMGYGDAGFTGQTMFTTPHLDKFAEEGMIFTHFYAAASVCAPSRGSAAQGLHTGHGRVLGNNATTWLKDTDVAFSEVLQEAGYRTGWFGKWGLGENSPLDNPETHGVDYFYGYVGNYHAHNFYPEWLVKNGEKIPLDNICTRNCGVEGETTQGRGVSENVHNDYGPFFVRDEAMDFLRRNGTTPEPFFMHYSPQMPHTNNEGGWDGHGQEVPDYGEFADETWPDVEKGFAQMMRYLDNDMGQIMFLLDSMGIDDNTLMIFTSDNGPHNEGGHNSNFFNSNGDFRGIKRNFWDGGIREPTAARWPGVIEAGSTTDYIGYSPDFMPTFGALAGMSIPSPTDGKSIVPTLLGNPDDQEQHDYLFWRTQTNGRTVKEGKWKYVNGELFDTDLDPGEENNVAGANPAVVNRLDGIISDATAGGAVDVSWTPLAQDPVLVGGCTDPAYSEYNAQADYSVAAACLNVIPVIRHQKKLLEYVDIDNNAHTFRVMTQSGFTLSLSDLKGRTLWSKSGTQPVTYSTSSIERGIYHLTLTTSRGTFTAPWVKL